jgi:hypothetical protein
VEHYSVVAPQVERFLGSRAGLDAIEIGVEASVAGMSQPSGVASSKTAKVELRRIDCLDVLAKFRRLYVDERGRS